MTPHVWTPDVWLSADGGAYVLDGGERLDRVTSVLRSLGLGADYSMVDPEVLARAQAIGRATHLATALDERGELDEETVDPAVAPRLAAWRAFVRESSWRSTAIEEPAYSTEWGVAGTPDRVGWLNGRRAVLDIKPPSYHPGVIFQLALYAVLLEPDGRRGEAVETLFSLQLGEGTYKLIDCSKLEPQWRTLAKQILAVHSAKRRHLK